MELDLIDYGFFLHLSGGTGRIVIILGVDMSSSTKTDNRGKNILVLGKGPTQGLEHALSAERMYSINFIDNNKKFCLIRRKLCGNCTFPQKLQTRKLGEITLFFAVFFC